MRLKNTMGCFTEFSFSDVSMDPQEFEDYKSKYLDLYDKVKSNTEKEKVSILDDLDFEVELLHLDIINVSYIIALLRQMQESSEKDKKKKRDEILGILDTEVQLRSKRELIERFITEQFPDIPKNADVGEEFEKYWDDQKQKAIEALGDSEDLDVDGLQKVIGDFLFTEKEPRRDEVIGIMNTRPSLKERGTITERIISKIKEFVETFIDGID